MAVFIRPPVGLAWNRALVNRGKAPHSVAMRSTSSMVRTPNFKPSLSMNRVLASMMSERMFGHGHWPQKLQRSTSFLSSREVAFSPPSYSLSKSLYNSGKNRQEVSIRNRHTSQSAQESSTCLAASSGETFSISSTVVLMRHGSHAFVSGSCKAHPARRKPQPSAFPHPF